MVYHTVNNSFYAIKTIPFPDTLLVRQAQL